MGVSDFHSVASLYLIELVDMLEVLYPINSGMTFGLQGQKQVSQTFRVRPVLPLSFGEAGCHG